MKFTFLSSTLSAVIGFSTLSSSCSKPTEPEEPESRENLAPFATNNLPKELTLHTANSYI